MSVGRAGTSQEALQYLSFHDRVRWTGIGSSGQTSDEADDQPELDLGPPPGVEWEVYAIDYHSFCRARNPAEDPENAPNVWWSLTFGDDLIDGENPIAPQAEEGDHAIIHHWQQWLQVWGGASTNPGGTGGTAGRHIHDTWKPEDGHPMMMDDRDNLTNVATAAYPAANTLSGGEQELFWHLSGVVHYKPHVVESGKVRTRG